MAAPKQLIELVERFDRNIDYVRENRHTVKRDGLDDKGWSLVDERTHALLSKLKTVDLPLV